MFIYVNQPSSSVQLTTVRDKHSFLLFSRFVTMKLKPCKKVNVYIIMIKVCDRGYYV